MPNEQPVPATTAEWRGPRFQSLDGLRALAALAIVLTHAASFSHTFRGGVGDFLSQLDTAVAVFFGLSGFLLYRPFTLAHQARRTAGPTRRYALRRLTRIYPAYWIALAFMVYGLGKLTFTSARNTIFGFSLLQLYGGSALQGLPQAWTLCVEITFYAFLPVYALVIRRCARRNPFRAELIGVGTLAVIGIAVEVHRELGGHPTAWTIGLLYLPVFASGMALAVLSARQELVGGLAWLDRIGRYAFVGVLVALACYVCIVEVVGVGVTTRTADTQLLWRYFLQIPLVIALVLPATFGTKAGGAVRAVLRHPVMAFLGAISYGIYLWHYPALIIVHDDLLGLSVRKGRLAVVFVLALALTLVFASVSWYLIERPLLRWSQRAGRKRELSSPTPSDVDVADAHDVALEATN